MPDTDTAVEEKKGVGGTTFYDEAVQLAGEILRKQVKRGLEQGLKQADKPIKMGFDAMLKDLDDKVKSAGSPDAVLELEHQVEMIKAMQPIYEKNFEDFAYDAGREVIEDISDFKLKHRKAETAGDLDVPPATFKFNVIPPDYRVKVRPDWESIVSSGFFGDLKKIDLDFDAKAYAKFRDDFGWQKYMKHFGVQGTVGCNMVIESVNATAAANAGVNLADDTATVGANVNGYWRKWTFSVNMDWNYNFRDGDVADWSASIFFTLNPSGKPFLPVEP
ncbi:MAG: hypothetical protein HYV14_00740 [Elusimicrobia bacterium]|nr:hypothetical protein [Elusimicrobiota bacterium]